MTTLTLYGKPGCHLCEEARSAIAPVCAERGLDVEEVDVTLDPVLYARYGERIPVLALDGEELFELFVDVEVLRRRLDRVRS
jgi:glutaredoxin